MVGIRVIGRVDLPGPFANAHDGGSDVSGDINVHLQRRKDTLIPMTRSSKHQQQAMRHLPWNCAKQQEAPDIETAH